MNTDESLPRNPVLAKFFCIAKLCESAGYGFDKMLEWKNQTGNEVLFETNVYRTKFTFMIDTTKAIREDDDMESGMETTENGTEKTDKKIIELMSKNSFITKIQLSENIGVSVSAINQQISKSKKQGILRRDGEDKGGKWVIIDKENK